MVGIVGMAVAPRGHLGDHFLIFGLIVCCVVLLMELGADQGARGVESRAKLLGIARDFGILPRSPRGC